MHGDDVASVGTQISKEAIEEAGKAAADSEEAETESEVSVLASTFSGKSGVSFEMLTGRKGCKFLTSGLTTFGESLAAKSTSGCLACSPCSSCPSSPS